MSLGHCGFVSTEATFLREISHIERCESYPQKSWLHYLNKTLVKCCISKSAFSELSRWRCCLLHKKSYI